MKSIAYQFILITGIFFLLCSFMEKNNSKTFNVNSEKSSIIWEGKKVAGKHTGEIKFNRSTLTYNGDVCTSLSFVVDMTSITCSDLTDQDLNKKLIAHLKSDDFFGVDQHPTASFKTTHVTPTEKNTYKISGNITIKGITQEITFPAVIKKENDIITGTANVTLDRTKFNVRYGSPSFFNLGDNAIYDDFTLQISLMAVAP